MNRDPVRVGVLSLHDSKETKAILNAVEALGHEPEWLREANTVVEARDGDATLTPDVDVLVNRLLLSSTDQPAEHLGVAQTLAALRPTLNHPDATSRAAHKVATVATLVGAGVSVPHTVFALGADELNRRRGTFGPEAVFKTAIGTHGGGTWRVAESDPLTATVGRRRAFLQAFVGTDGPPRDLRVYVVGGEVVGAMYRTAPAGDWRTNVARGGSVEDATATLPDAAHDFALRATAALGLDYAGVDLIEGEDGWFVLEVNPTAGFRGLYRATGCSPAPYIAKLAIERVGRDVDADLVRELSATLDDSTPTCVPRPETTRPDPVVVGLTERVVVSGTTGTETVVAEADSGAARTAIDLPLAAAIGAGPIHTAGDSTDPEAVAEERPVVDLVVGIGGAQHTVAATIEDRRDAHPVSLGRDVLRNYHLDVSRRATTSTGAREESSPASASPPDDRPVPTRSSRSRSSQS
ncbi:RimK family alpha-L-glutamate ligase [Halobium salinum]|uniref:RimK family alpha-L-glutamate ligase n=1 Tax=Halobium salinum TaxID=1364940 RepID=A0ABD5P9T6_9EURY|nr:RimK family alpha-L-glutamate ligase [Halobium salinum]